MNLWHFGCFLVTIILIILCTAIPGCTSNHYANLTSAEIHSLFLENAGNIHDYRSEFHFSKTGGRVSYDWKEPGYFRMEYLESERPAAGTLYVMNRTTGIAYNSQEKKFEIKPDMRYLREHDYQNMVLRIVQSKDYTVIGKMQENGRTLYGIEIVTEPWSTAYTTYVSSKVVAWIDPATGLAWNISTYYPSDTLNRNIRYDRISTNTGIPDSHFIFNPPQESAIQCGSASGISSPDQYDPRNLSPALKPGCLDCTGMLLTKPVGGFSGDYLLVGMVDYTGTGRTVKIDPHRSVNYTFYSRNMSRGTVRYTISRVAGLYRTEPLPAMNVVTITIEPAVFTAEPNREYTSEMTVHVKPGTDLHENFWIHLHAEVEGVPDAITDDWIRLAIDDGGTMSGSGLWHFYQPGGGYCQKVLVVPQGGTGHTWFAIRTAELDTGNATLNLVTVPCIMDHGPLREDERPPWPEGIHASITPANFTVRSFASYLPEMSFTVDPIVKPGDYCFSAVRRTPGGGGEYAPFTLRVISSGS
jgi:outer membrane lipoprotein-sorting protein